MRYATITILSIILLFSFFYCNAQPDNQYTFRHIDQSDGLLHNRIFSITQDNKRYMWVLSANGLQRYDGNRFVNYPYDPGNEAGITYGQDCRLFADKKNNRLWIINENMEQLDLQKNEFIYYKKEQYKNDSSFGFEKYEDASGNTSYVGNFGFFKNISENKFPHYFTATALTGSNGVSFITDKEQSWLSLWSDGLFLFDKKTKKIYSHSYNPIKNPLLELMDKNELFYIFQDHEKNIWISSSQPEFFKYNPVTQKITTYSLTHIKGGSEKGTDKSLLVHCFFEDDHHTLWVGTQNAGLLEYNKEANRFITVSGKTERQQGIKYNYDINCIFQDKEENIWLGTDKGITIFNPYRKYFEAVYHDKNDSSSLPGNEIEKCIESANGDILAGSWGGGISVFDNQWHFRKNIHFTDSIWEKNFVWSFIQNDNQTIWAGCQHGYIHIYDPLTKKMQTIQPPELNKLTIYCMTKDKAGNIFFGLYDGRIAKWDKAENKFYAYNKNIPGIPQTYAPVISIYIDEQQNCWAATENGMKQFDADNMKYTAVYTTDKKDPHSITSNIIHCIEGYNDSTLIIGTMYGGLDFFNKHSKKFYQVESLDAKTYNSINNIKKDEQNNLWFTTDYDLYKYTTKENKTVKYNIDPGILNATFKPGNFCMLKDGRWVANTNSEIISFHPAALQKQDTTNAHVDITGLKIFDKDIFIDSFLYQQKPVNLSYRQNFLSIEYGVLNFSGLEETKYYYRLTEVDKDWVFAGSKRTANYTDLEPGSYNFEVKTENQNNNQNITSFSIIITPPFWKTTLFRLLMILLAAAILYFIFWQRIKTIRHEAELKHRIAETEMMALRAQMNPHFIFNCINSIDALIQSNDKYQATVYLNKFAKLIRNILDSSKQNLVTLSKDMQTLQLYIDLEKFRNENKFTATIDAEKELMQDNYKIPPLIIQSYVENAIIHGLKKRKDNDGTLFISVTKQHGRLRFIIEDNGVGRQAAANTKREIKTSYGMQMSSERVKLFNKEETASVFITDLEKEGKAAGTKVEVFLNI